MTYLTVTAHPDDEVLGFGGSSFKFALKGHIVYNLILNFRLKKKYYFILILKLKDQNV